MQRTAGTSEHVYVVYTGDKGVSKSSMIDKVQVRFSLPVPSLLHTELTLPTQQSRFGITLDPSSLSFVILNSRFLVEDSTWKRFTLAGQSFGSILLAIEALWWHRDAIVPDEWIDTMGYSFTYPLVRYFCRIPVASYTHYPTIS
jgi:alpha-1,2-mannosyltransferase